MSEFKGGVSIELNGPVAKNVKITDSDGRDITRVRDIRIHMEPGKPVEVVLERFLTRLKLEDVDVEVVTVCPKCHEQQDTTLTDCTGVDSVVKTYVRSDPQQG